MDKEKEELERLAYALMLMEHFYAIAQEISTYKGVNGIGGFKTMFPYWNNLSNEFIQSVYCLLKPVDPVLADIWDRSAYADIKEEVV